MTLILNSDRSNVCVLPKKETLIVTTSTTPKHQNKDEDGDVNPALRHVAVQVDDVTPLQYVGFPSILRCRPGGRHDAKVRCRLRLRHRFGVKSW